MIGLGDSGVQAMSGIRGPDPALSFLAIQRDRVGRNLIAPEGSLKAGSQRFCLGLQLSGARSFAENGCQPGRPALGRVDVALHFAQRDWSPCQRAVGMEDGIIRIFPTLLDQSILGMARILHQTVAVAIAVSVDPGQGAFQVWPNSPDQR